MSAYYACMQYALCIPNKVFSTDFNNFPFVWNFLRILFFSLLVFGIFTFLHIHKHIKSLMIVITIRIYNHNNNANGTKLFFANASFFHWLNYILPLTLALPLPLSLSIYLMVSVAMWWIKTASESMHEHELEINRKLDPDTMYIPTFPPIDQSCWFDFYDMSVIWLPLQIYKFGVQNFSRSLLHRDMIYLCCMFVLNHFRTFDRIKE